MLAMLCNCFIPVYASTTENEISTATYTFNEYERVESLQKYTDTDLINLGYTTEDINVIRNADTVIQDEMNRLSCLENTQLSDLGYTVEQIDIIRNYDAKTTTSVELLQVTGKCDVTVSVSNYTGTSATIKAEFNWISQPIFKLSDILTTVWNNWYITGKSALIKYVNMNNTSDYFYGLAEYHPPKENLVSYGSGYIFPVLRDEKYYSKSGYTIFEIECKTEQHLNTLCVLGHEQVIASDEYSISGVDVSFSIGRKAHYSNQINLT